MRGRPIFYSDAEMAWLEANRTMIISDYHRAFLERFQRHDVSALNLHGLRKRKGWFVGRASGRFFGRHRKFSTEEMDWLRENAGMVVSDYCREFCAKFGREDVYPRFLHALRKRKGWKTGRTGQFEKGMTPVNKGKPCPPGKSGRHPNARKTQFKKGQRPHTYKGAGHERIDSRDGYVILIVEERNPWTGAPTRPVLKHRWLWEKINGPVPKGMVLKCRDGNKQNTDPSNWELVPKALLPRLAGRHTIAYDTAPAELKPTIMAVAKLEHATREAKRRNKDT